MALSPSSPSVMVLLYFVLSWTFLLGGNGNGVAVAGASRSTALRFAAEFDSVSSRRVLLNNGLALTPPMG